MGITYDTVFGLNKPFRFKLYISHVGNTSFVYSIDMYDFNTGAKYGRCDSKVVYVDAKTRRPVKLPQQWIEEAKHSMIKHNIKPRDINKLGLFKVPDSALTYKLKVLHSDCDRNLHVNQSIFVRWCADALYYYFRKRTNNDEEMGFHIEKLAVQYIGEVLVNDTVCVNVWVRSEEIFFAIMNGFGKQIFNAVLRLHDFNMMENIDGSTNHLNSKL